MHLLLGHSWDSCCAGVLARLEARGLPARIVPAPLTAPARLVWRLDAAGLASRLNWDDQEAELAGVLVRGTGWLDPAGWDPTDHAYMQAEMLAATLAWLAGLPCPVINRPSAALWYRGRASLMTWRTLLRSHGLPVPEQLVTNDPGEARNFGHRLAALGVAGAVYTPLTGETGYLVATDAGWQGLAALQARAPVCLSEPHGAPLPACIIGGQIVWDCDPPPEARALEPRLCRLAADAGLDFLEVVVAPLRRGLAVVRVDAMPMLEHYAPPAQDRILDSLTALLASGTASYAAPEAEP